ncbi:MAG: CBS domain-containing protein [bacterium]|nr:CBS domain-containing protein [bacterium]
MRTIQELLKARGYNPVHTIKPSNTLLEAVAFMVDLNIGAVLAVEDNCIKGIITERDYLRFIAGEGHSARDTPVHELMTKKVIYVTPEATLDSAMRIMTKARIRHIPVLENGNLVGMISIGDLVKQISSNQEVQISTLEEYISDNYPGPNVST